MFQKLRFSMAPQKTSAIKKSDISDNKSCAIITSQNQQLFFHGTPGHNIPVKQIQTAFIFSYQFKFVI